MECNIKQYQCCGCDACAVEQVLDLGKQPPSNMFLADRNENFPTHALRLGVCNVCGLVQLINLMPLEVVRCRHPWLTYNEPENYLNALADYLANLVLGSGRMSPRMLGISYKDNSLLRRLEQRGWKRCAALGLQEQSVGIEVLQGRITPAWARNAAGCCGLVDVVLARHILEHARRPSEFVKACGMLACPGGLLVFEVPGCDSMLNRNEHYSLWEEHITYFTRATLKRFLSSCGLEVLEIREYTASPDPSLVALARSGGSQHAVAYSCGVMDDVMRARRFAASLPVRAAMARSVLARWRASGTLFGPATPVALFGAGHLGMKYINFYGLAPLLQIVIDDHPNKLGRFLPGSLLPVVSSDWLRNIERGICLLAFNPDNQARVMAAHTKFTIRGGRWFSIFADDPQCQKRGTV